MYGKVGADIFSTLRQLGRTLKSVKNIVSMAEMSTGTVTRQRSNRVKYAVDLVYQFLCINSVRIIVFT